jgi:hypothetical protein
VRLSRRNSAAGLPLAGRLCAGFRLSPEGRLQMPIRATQQVHSTGCEGMLESFLLKGQTQ